jgi:acyl-CoA synthetase (AMP-forming)/AMP-acid ligase II
MSDLAAFDHLWPLIDGRAEATPDASFAIDERLRPLTFFEYRNACLRCAAGLAEAGVEADTVVSWQLPTTLEALILVGGLARLGAIQNPILPILREREVGFIVAQTRARLLFVPRVFRDFDFEAMGKAVASEQDGLEVRVLEDGLPDADPTNLPPAPGAPAPEESPVRWILYSSGTTADPKGVRHADPSVAGPGRAMNQCFEATASDRHAFVFPLTHIGGINWLFSGLMAGFGHVCFEAFRPPETIAFMREQGVTLAGAGTAFHQAYLAAQEDSSEPVLPNVRCYPGGGAPKPPQLFHALKAATGAPIVSGYGLTEHPIAVMNSIGDPDEKLARTEGRATAGTEIRIVRSDGSAAAVGQEGEVRVRGPHLFRGYVDERLNESAFDEAGFLRTGDLGALDAGGWLTITGRLKDVIIRKGENVSAKEVEDHLYAHPEVSDVAVIGLPDAARGEMVCAIVVAPEGLGFEEMVAWLKQRGLMLQKIPERLELVDEIARNPAGKIVKRELIARYRG